MCSRRFVFQASLRTVASSQFRNKIAALPVAHRDAGGELHLQRAGHGSHEARACVHSGGRAQTVDEPPCAWVVCVREPLRRE